MNSIVYKFMKLNKTEEINLLQFFESTQDREMKLYQVSGYSKMSITTEPYIIHSLWIEPILALVGVYELFQLFKK